MLKVPKEPKNGININTEKLLKQSRFYMKIDKSEKQSKENLKTIMLIDYYTRLKEKNIFKTLLNIYFHKIININLNDINYNEERKRYEYKLDNGKILTFNMISNNISDEELVQELTSKNRKHKCHKRSLELSPSFENSNILTGYVTLKKNKILHSVVETTLNGQEVILDWTFNIEMPKKEYIDLFKFKILSSISAKNLENDLDLIGQSSVNITDKTYLVFRDELIKDLEKNKQLFENNEIHKKR